MRSTSAIPKPVCHKLFAYQCASQSQMSIHHCFCLCYEDFLRQGGYILHVLCNELVTFGEWMTLWSTLDQYLGFDKIRWRFCYDAVERYHRFHLNVSLYTTFYLNVLVYATFYLNVLFHTIFHLNVSLHTAFHLNVSVYIPQPILTCLYI